jgi:basic membrane lipoprotein Med (substrate-binding protein (PBP1-ABC) superfamily)
MRHPAKPGRRGRAQRRWLYIGLAPLIAVLVAAISAASGFAPQAAAATRSAAAQPVTTIGYALSGPANDGGYYQNQAQEIVRLGRQHGIKVIVAQNADPNSAAVFEDLARQGAQVVIADGSEFTPAMLTFSKNPAFQSTLPLMISGDPPVAPTFATAGGNELQAHFMGGVAAGLLLQQHGKTGACDVAGPNIAFVKNAAAAMQQGLHYVNPNYQFHVTFTGDFNNTALAASASKALIAQGCYVLYPYLGGAIPAALNEVTKAHVLGVATSFNRCGTPPIAMSILYNPSFYLPSVVQALEKGQIHRGQHWRLFSVGSDVGIGAVICNPTAHQTQVLDQVRQKLASGQINVPALIHSDIQG